MAVTVGEPAEQRTHEEPEFSDQCYLEPQPPDPRLYPRLARQYSRRDGGDISPFAPSRLIWSTAGRGCFASTSTMPIKSSLTDLVQEARLGAIETEAQELYML